MIPWHQIETVLLDMDGTLLDLHFDSHFWREYVPRRYAASRGLDVTTAKRLLTPLFMRHEGTLEWYCLDFWSQELGLEIAELKRDVAHLIAMLDGAGEFLEALRATGRRVVLVTNAHPNSLALKLEHTRLESYLDRIISAHEIGLPKEEVLFWSKLQALESFSAERTLLVDDNLVALRSARSYGIAHLLAAGRTHTKEPPWSTTEFPFFHDFSKIMPPD